MGQASRCVAAIEQNAIRPPEEIRCERLGGLDWTGCRPPLSRADRSSARCSRLLVRSSSHARGDGGPDGSGWKQQPQHAATGRQHAANAANASPPRPSSTSVANPRPHNPGPTDKADVPGCCAHACTFAGIASPLPAGFSDRRTPRLLRPSRALDAFLFLFCFVFAVSFFSFLSSSQHSRPCLSGKPIRRVSVAAECSRTELEADARASTRRQRRRAGISPCVGSAGYVAPTAIADSAMRTLSQCVPMGDVWIPLLSGSTRPPPDRDVCFRPPATCHLSLVRNATVHPKKKKGKREQGGYIASYPA